MENITTPEPQIILLEDFIKSEIDCVLFDFDGVFLPQEIDFMAEQDGFREATGYELLLQDANEMAGKNWQEGAVELMIRAVRRDTRKTQEQIDAEIEKIRAEEPIIGDMGPRTKFFRQVKDNWLENNPDKIKAYEHIVEAVNYFSNKGTPMAIVTTSPRRKVVELCLPPMGFKTDMFYGFYTKEDFQESAQKKPSAYPWDTALADSPTSRDPRKCLIWEDSAKNLIEPNKKGFKHIFAPELESQIDNDHAREIMNKPFSDGISLFINVPVTVSMLEKFFIFTGVQHAKTYRPRIAQGGITP